MSVLLPLSLSYYFTLYAMLRDDHSFFISSRAVASAEFLTRTRMLRAGGEVLQRLITFASHSLLRRTYNSSHTYGHFLLDGPELLTPHETHITSIL